MNIDEMILRIPGLSERDGRMLAEEVSQGLADSLPDRHVGGHISELNVQLQISGELSRKHLAQQIIQAITQRLQPK